MRALRHNPATPWVTLRSWSCTREMRGVVEEFFVHPQAVRYCMSQLRELYGDSLEDARFVMEVTLALA